MGDKCTDKRMNIFMQEQSCDMLWHPYGKMHGRGHISRTFSKLVLMMVFSNLISAKKCSKKRCDHVKQMLLYNDKMLHKEV